MNYTFDEWCEKMNEIELPLIQRDFVWQSWQIENLWDSIYHSIPLPPFFIEERGGKEFLYDGQQRSSALYIVYAWANNFPSNKLNINPRHYRLFMDIAPDKINNDDDSDFFWLITLGNPWGFSKSKKNRNISRLRLCETRKWTDAMKDVIGDSFKKHEYKEINEKYFPYFANIAIPVDLLYKGDYEKIKDWIKDVVSKKPIEKKDLKKREPFFETDAQNNIKFTKDFNSWLEEKRKNLFDKEIANQNNVPLNNGNLISTMTYVIRTLEQESLIFNRLNSSGTRFDYNDQFLYKIKGIINDQEALKKIENYSSIIFVKYKFMVIILAILYGSTLEFKDDKFIDDKNGVKIDKKEINKWMLTVVSRPKMYSRQVLENFKSYKYSYLIDILSKQGNEIENKLKEIKKFISYSEQNKIGFPRIMIQKIFNSCPEILLELMRKWDFFKIQKKKSVLCFIVKIYVFGMNKKKKTEYYNIANNIKSFIWGNNENLDDLYSHLKNHSNGGTLYDITDGFIKGERDKYINNEISLIYAQREYIESLFPETDNYILLEDVNKPFDSDHIFPHKFCSTKSGIDALKPYDQVNSNRRLLDLSENRSTHDDNPVFQLPIEEWKTKSIDEIEIDNKSSTLIKFKGGKTYGDLLKENNIDEKEYKKSFVDKEDFKKIFLEGKLTDFFKNREEKIWKEMFD